MVKCRRKFVSIEDSGDLPPAKWNELSFIHTRMSHFLILFVTNSMLYFAMCGIKDRAVRASVIGPWPRFQAVMSQNCILNVSALDKQ